MSDEKIRGDEEYHYPEEEYVVDPQHAAVEEPIKATTQEPTDGPAPVKSEPVWMQFLKRNKRIVLVVLVVIVALVAFQVMNYKKNNKVIMKAQPKPVAVQKVKPQPQNNDAVQQNMMLQQSLNAIRQSDAEKDAQITNLKGELRNLQAQMSQANRTNQQTKQAMVLLLQELKHVNAQLQEKKQAKPSGPPAPQLVYRVRAIVKGRAWVVGSNGLSESVTVGDPVPGYGVVESIDPERGLITTSTGKDIRYGLNDF